MTKKEKVSIHKKIKLSKLKQKEVATQLGISPQQLCSFLQGRAYMSSEKVEQLRNYIAEFDKKSPKINDNKKQDIKYQSENKNVSKGILEECKFFFATPQSKLEMIGLKYSKEYNSLVYPIKNIDDELVKLGMIQLNEDYTKKGFIQLGEYEGDCCYYFKQGISTNKVIIIRGFENFMTLLLEGDERYIFYDFIVPSDIQGFNKITSFLKGYDEKIIILDNDKEGQSLKASECFKNIPNVKRMLPTLDGIKDTNEALQKKKLTEFIETLKEVQFNGQRS